MLNEPRRGGMSFVFAPVNGKGATASGSSLTAVYDLHPELRERTLDQVWCHCCANCLWMPTTVHGTPAEPWPEDFDDGSAIPIELHIWDAAILRAERNEP